MDFPDKRGLVDGPGGYRGHHGGGKRGTGSRGPGGAGGRQKRGGRRGKTRHERTMDRRRRGEIGGRADERRRREAQQAAARQAAQQAAQQAAAKKAAEEAARKAAEEAAARQAAAEAAKRAQEEAARKAAEEAARKAAAEAARVAEQQRLAAIEEQRRRDAEEAARQRAAEEARRQAELQRAQALGTVVTTGPMASLNRPADPLPRYRGYTPMDYDVSRTGSLTDQYSRMLNVPFFQPFIAQEDINLAPGATTADSIFGVESLLPNYTFDPLSQTASNPYFSARQGGRVQKDMGGFIGFMDEPLNIMHPTTKIDVVDGGISSILKKYKEIRSEL